MRLRIIRLEPSFLGLVNTPDTNILFSVIFALKTIFFPLINASSFFTITSSSCESGNENLELDVGESIMSSSSPFSIISRIILSLVTFFDLVKWFLRFPALKFWISLFRIGIISYWNLKIMAVPTLLQLSFSCSIAIIYTPVVAFGGCCSFWFGCCTHCFDFQGFLEIFASFLNFYSKENWNSSATFFDWSQWCLSHHLIYYLTEILMV